jgi:hypothetical protein
MGTDFVEAVTSVLTGITGWFTSVFSAIGAILYTPGVGEAPGSLTVIGWIMAVIVGLSVVGFGIKFVMSLVKRIKA